MVRRPCSSLCKDCPVATIRGNGASISKGVPDKVFKKQMVPGPECAVKLTAEDLWLPCEQCPHAEVQIESGEERVELKDLEFCVMHCPVKEIRDAVEECDAEARMS